MSRVNEALNRAGRGHLSGIAVPGADPFDPAWSVDAEDTKQGPADEFPKVASRVVGSYPALRGFSGEWRERLVTGASANVHLVEQFRRLAATLHTAQGASGLRTLMVTSASPGDGKTLTAINLALVLSESYRRNVLLVDADLRNPSIGDIADVTGSAGLSEALRSSAEQKLALLSLRPGLTLLPAGRPDPDPIGGLTSMRMRRILEEASQRFDWVILDAPPIGPVADAALLGEMTQGALLVVRAGRTHHELVKKAIEIFGREKILGVILNAVELDSSRGYDGYYYSKRTGSRQLTSNASDIVP